jgi:hypothetical protein
MHAFARPYVCRYLVAFHHCVLWQDKPFCVVLSKHDLPAVHSRSEFNMILKLPELDALFPRRITVVTVSSLSGEGCGAVLEWLVTQKERSLGLPQGPSHVLR